MADKNILKELNSSKQIEKEFLLNYFYTIIFQLIEIEILDKNIKDLKSVIDKEKNEMDAIEAQINTLKAKYEMKRLDVYQLNSKLEDKTKIVNEAKKAYTKVQKKKRDRQFILNY